MLWSEKLIVSKFSYYVHINTVMQHNNALVNDGPHIQCWWSPKIISKKFVCIFSFTACCFLSIFLSFCIQCWKEIQLWCWILLVLGSLRSMRRISPSYSPPILQPPRQSCRPELVTEWRELVGEEGMEIRLPPHSFWCPSLHTLVFLPSVYLSFFSSPVPPSLACFLSLSSLIFSFLLHSISLSLFFHLTLCLSGLLSVSSLPLFPLLLLKSTLPPMVQHFNSTYTYTNFIFYV